MASIQNIKEQYQTLTRKQRVIADFLLANPEDICYISLKDLSSRTTASEITILRMCKKLGFEGYMDIKNAFRQHTQQLVKKLCEPDYFVPDMPSAEQSDKIDLLRQICQSDYTNFSDFYNIINIDDIFKTARQILKAKTVLICGHGISKIITDFFHHRLNALGINAIPLSPEDMSNVQAHLTRLQPGDHLIAISFPRYYSPIHNIAKYAEYKGATVTAITDSLMSPVVTQNSNNIFCKTSSKVFHNSLTLPIALVNLIASCVVIEMGPQYDKLIADTHEVADFIKQ